MTFGDVFNNVLYILLGIAALAIFIVLATQAFKDPASRKGADGESDKPDGTL